MKRTAITRKSPLKRRTRLKQKRATPRRSSRVRDRAYLLWVKSRPCVAIGMPYGGCATHKDCSDTFEARDAHHAGRHHAGAKCNDREAIPLCPYMHQFWHNAAGPFVGWDKAKRRAWADAQIAATQRAWAEERGP